MKKIAVIGEAMLELSQQSNTSLALSFAGDTLNFATYLRRLLPTNSFTVYYVTALGCDSYSDNMLKNWREEKINTDLIYRLKNKLPGLYLIRNDEKGERFFYFYRENSAARELFKEDITPALSERLLTMDYLYLSGITLAILESTSRERLWKLLKEAKEKNIIIIFDTNYRDSLWPDRKSAKDAIEKTLRWVDIVFPTFLDEKKLFGDTSAKDCAERLSKNGITEIIVKCGAYPAYVDTIKEQVTVSACRVKKVIDTTGAGDSFNAAYIAARLLGLNSINATKWGHQLAATVITYRGAIIPITIMPHLH